MKRSYVLLCAITLAVLSVSCSLDDDQTNFKYATLKTASASLPDTFELGRVYNIDVTLLRPDDCTFAERFDVGREITDTTNIRTVVPIGVVIEGQECTQVNDSIQDAFQFEVVYDRPYTFKFYTGDGANGEAEFFEIEVPVKHGQ